MKIIFAGFSKCGTKTMAEALRVLGFTVCDFIESFEYHCNEWRMIFQHGATTEQFFEMYKDVDAVTDLPCCYYWEEIHKAFPEAKIIFTERDSEERWWKSMKSQIQSGDGFFMNIMHHLSPTSYKIRRWGRELGVAVFGLDLRKDYLGRTTLNEMSMRLTYRKHNAYFLMNSPIDQTLNFKLKDGWKPLCEFLEVPCPEQAFPHKNKGASFYNDLIRSNGTVHKMLAEMVIFGSSIFGLIAYLFYNVLYNYDTSYLSYHSFRLILQKICAVETFPGESIP